MLKKCSPLAKNRHDMHGSCGPMSGHEASQIRVPIGHLDRESQIAYIFEEAQKKGDVVIFEVALAQDEKGYV